MNGALSNFIVWRREKHVFFRFLHPLLCQREDDIDAVLLRVKEQVVD